MPLPEKPVDLSHDRMSRIGGEHDLTTRRAYRFTLPNVTLDIESPKDGDVYLVGDKIQLKAKVKEGGSDASHKPTWEVKPEGTLDPAKETLILEKEGETEITATLPKNQGGAEKKVKIKAVLPHVVSIEFIKGDEGDLYPLYDHSQSAVKPPLWKKEPDDPLPYGHQKPAAAVKGKEDEAPLPHPACYKLGSKVKAKISFKLAAAPTKPAKIDFWAAGKTALPAKGPADKKAAYAGKTLDFRLAESDRSAGKEVSQAEWNWELPGAVPLPTAIGRYDLSSTLYYRVNGEVDGFRAPADKTEGWQKMGEASHLVAYCTWGAPKIGGPSSRSAGAQLKQEEYDRFHVEKGCTWADGCWNLKLRENDSIVFKADNMFRHYRFPDAYDHLDGKRIGYWKGQSEPGNYKYYQGQSSIFYPPLSDSDKPPYGGNSAYYQYFSNNFGWWLLDNPENPGGRCNQQASLIVAIFNTLGITASVHYVESRKNGSLLVELHDLPAPNSGSSPLEGFTSACLKACREKTGWDHTFHTWNFHGIVKVPKGQGAGDLTEGEDTYYDGSFSSPANSWPPYSKEWWRGGVRKHDFATIALKTGRDLKPRDKPTDKKRCLCVHGGTHAHPSEKAKCDVCGSPPEVDYKCWSCGAKIVPRGNPQPYEAWIGGACPSCKKPIEGMWCENIYHSCRKCMMYVGENDTSCVRCGASNP